MPRKERSTRRDELVAENKLPRPQCDGCAFCLDVCPFKALKVISNKNPGDFVFQRHVEIDNELCKGCGLCQGTCPKDAIYVQGFSSNELSNQISEALAEEVK